MAGYGKLGRTSDQRRALIKSQVTTLLYYGHIRAAETGTKEICKIVEGLIAMAMKKKDDYKTVKATAKVARKDKDGKRVKEVVGGRKATVYDEVEKEVKKDMPSRLYTRGQMLKVLYGMTGVPSTLTSKKKNTKSVDMVTRPFDDTAPKYTSRNGGYIRIVKVGPRKDNAATEVLIELV